jgi:hypothetical protein
MSARPRSLYPPRSSPLPSNPGLAIAATTCTQRQTWACIGVRGLGPDCADSAQSSKVLALADGPEARLEPVEDLQGALVIGRYYSGWNSIKNRAEIFVGLWDAPLFQQ